MELLMSCDNYQHVDLIRNNKNVSMQNIFIKKKKKQYCVMAHSLNTSEWYSVNEKEKHWEDTLVVNLGVSTDTIN